MKGRKCFTLLLTKEEKYGKLRVRAGKHLIPFLIRPPVKAGSPGRDALPGAEGRARRAAAGGCVKSHHGCGRQLGCKAYGVNSSGKTDLHDGLHLEPVRDQTMLWQVETA